MLDYIGLTAILKRQNKTRLLRIPLKQDLQRMLSADWQEQYSSFTVGVDEIPFDPGYRIEENELFALPDFRMPEWLNRESPESIQDLDAINTVPDSMEDICGIVGFAVDRSGQPLHLFQNFSRSRVIQPRRILFLDGKSYSTSKDRALSLSSQLAAVHSPQDRKLLFRDFRATNSFLPLSDFYKEASEQEIRGVLSHPLLGPDNIDALASEPSPWFRKRFAMLRDSGLLNQVSASDLQRRASGYPVRVDVVNDKVVFPSDKRSAKRLLQFLNEEIFRGAITQTVYETNSKRETAQ